LVAGKTNIESSLHLNLIEHINSEISLSTISGIETAQQWLRGTFLYQRVQKNPTYYGIGKDRTRTWQQTLDELVNTTVEKLKSNGLVCTKDKEDVFECTEYGRLMAKVSKLYPAPPFLFLRDTALHQIYDGRQTLHPNTRDLKARKMVSLMGVTDKPSVRELVCIDPLNGVCLLGPHSARASFQGRRVCLLLLTRFRSPLEGSATFASELVKSRSVK
jgi:hypothetical protein